MNSSPIQETGSLARPSGRILVVDDESHVLAVAKAILESQGFNVQGCSTGEEALEVINSCAGAPNRFNVMVLDLTLPGGMSGFEVLEAVQSIDSDLRIIACSGYFQEDARDLCQAIGFADILQKPYPLEDLCAIVRRCLVRERQPNLAPA
jgi:CheY-like chemotaxis protein